MGKIFNLLAVFAVIFTVALMVPTMSKAGDLEVGGYVSIVAEGNTDDHADGFAVEEVEINFHKELAEGVSVTVDTQFLGDANVTGVTIPAGSQYDESDEVSLWDETHGVAAFGIEQAFVTLPAGPVALQVGLFNLPIGLEGADKTDLTTASHSLIFDHAVPTSGAGVMASFAPEGAPVTVDLYVINGWDSAEDNNSGKTVGGRIGFDIGDIANIGVSYITGRENQTGDGGGDFAEYWDNGIYDSIAGGESVTEPWEYNDSETTVMDIDITITPIEALTLAIEINEGEQTNMGISQTGNWAGKPSDGEWSAMTLSAHYKLNENCGVTVRLEEFEDTDMNIFGVESKKSFNGGKIAGATFESTTVAISHHIADGAELILEYREIEADVDKDQQVFGPVNSSTGKGETSAEMITAELIYQF